MMKKEELDMVSYILGVVSIVLAFFQPLAAFVFGVVGFVHGKKGASQLSSRARKLNIIGIVLSIIFFAATMVLTFYFTKTGLNSLI
ncbi:MAG: hypothetical protein AABX28_01350 [Nanoarchaeota archaeon]